LGTDSVKIADRRRQASSGIRWRVLAGLCALSFLTIIDRVSISAAKNEIAGSLKITDQTFGFVFGAFALGYAIFMVPSGWLADRFGPRRFLTAIVAAWSLFTLGTGLASAVPILIALRFCFGGAEAGAYPTAARAIYNWLPRSERGLALGLLNAGSRMGAAIGLSVVSASIGAFGWRASFLILAVCGATWAIWWYGWFRDDPRAMRGVSSSELEKICGDAIVPSSETSSETKDDGRSLMSVDALLVILQYFCSNFTFFLCFSWLLPYLRQRFSLAASEAAFYSSIPLYCGALATYLSGLTVDALFRRGYWNRSRQLPAMFGFGLAAVCLIAASRCSTVGLFLACFSLTIFGVDFTLSPSWSAASDLGGARTGTMSAAMNTLGSLGAFASSVMFPWMLQQTGSVTAFFEVATALNLLAVLLWSRIQLQPAGGSHGVANGSSLNP
jgi:ACS family glucarate transporter-like MFS transporter